MMLTQSDLKSVVLDHSLQIFVIKSFQYLCYFREKKNKNAFCSAIFSNLVDEAVQLPCLQIVSKLGMSIITDNQRRRNIIVSFSNSNLLLIHLDQSTKINVVANTSLSTTSLSQTNMEGEK
ncbi:hypothetical protein V6Z11_D12G081900 [Gossypium hirsutum]